MWAMLNTDVRAWPWPLLPFCFTFRCLAIPLCGCPVKQALSSCRDGRPFANNRHGPKSGGAAVPLSVGQLGPHLTQCGLGRGLPP